jgi:hypothetical protein
MRIAPSALWFAFIVCHSTFQYVAERSEITL